MTTDTPDFIDALPYIETAIDDDEEQRAIAMKEVDDEIDSFPPSKDYLEYLPNVESRAFTTPIIEYEHFCIESNEPRPPSSRLNELEVDIPPKATSVMNDEDLGIWNKCLNQIKIKLEYKQRQLDNLKWLQDNGIPILEQFITINESVASCLRKEINDLSRRTHEINYKRKTEQESVSKTLDILKNDCNTLIDKNCILAKEVRRLNYLT